MENRFPPPRRHALFLAAASILGLLLFAGCQKKEGAEGGKVEAGAGAPIPAQPPVPGALVVTAKLLEVPGEFPANDLYNYAYIMKYEVQKVVQGDHAEKEILVGHYNPRFARDAIKDEQDSKVGGNLKTFNAGDIHYLVLNPMEGLWSQAVEDEYYKDQGPRFWASWADKL